MFFFKKYKQKEKKWTPFLKHERFQGGQRWYSLFTGVLYGLWFWVQLFLPLSFLHTVSFSLVLNIALTALFSVAGTLFVAGLVFLRFFPERFVVYRLFSCSFLSAFFLGGIVFLVLGAA